MRKNQVFIQVWRHWLL